MFLLGDKVITRIWAKHDTDPDRYQDVLLEMLKLGPPTIRCVEFGGEFYAIEGSHRLKAAHALGLHPVVELVKAELSWGLVDEFWDMVRLTLPPYSWEEFQ